MVERMHFAQMVLTFSSAVNAPTVLDDDAVQASKGQVSLDRCNNEYLGNQG